MLECFGEAMKHEFVLDDGTVYGLYFSENGIFAHFYTFVFIWNIKFAFDIFFVS